MVIVVVFFGHYLLMIMATSKQMNDSQKYMDFFDNASGWSSVPYSGF